MGAFAYAYIHAKPLSKREKREIVRKPKKGLPTVSKAQIDAIHDLAALQDAQRSIPPDRGYAKRDCPILRQAMPATKLARPSYPRIATQPFAKSIDPKLIDVKKLQICQEQVFIHAEAETPQPSPPAHSHAKMDDAAYDAIIAEADAARAQHYADAHAQGSINYLKGFMT